MSARALIVDDVAANVRLLEARLQAEYFEVLTAASGPEALACAGEDQPDIILLDVMMPGMDGFEVCRRLKADPATHHIPVIMVTALDQPADRVRGLEAGADDFLTKPVGDIALLSRVKSLVRLKMLTDELRSRAETSREMGIADPFAEASHASGENGKVFIVDDRIGSSNRMVKALKKRHQVFVEARPQEALFRIADDEFDMVIVSLGLEDFDGLRLCSQIRSLERTRHVPILVAVDPEEEGRLLRALELGVNDYVLRPIDPNELVARTATQVRRRRYSERLRDNVQMSVAMAVTDSLTGLHNRRYFDGHIRTLAQHCSSRNRPLSMLLLDIDHFKAVNDSYGHDAGDEVLKEFSRRMRREVRGVDLACRLGGEEFIVVMPETAMPAALAVGERIRHAIEAEPFPIYQGREAISITVSIGAARLEGPDDTPEALTKRADAALYNAKARGRNQVCADAA